MKISELIKELEEIKTEYGDVEVEGADIGNGKNIRYYRLCDVLGVTRFNIDDNKKLPNICILEIE